uniref:Tyrosine-protein phosphatase domain-containing protein n=1 Tax=Ciona savignyi TaxID=51511 RepID=H2Z832_CIOSA
MLISELPSSSGESSLSKAGIRPIPNKMDWKYSQRRDMQLILPGLYLGPLQVACKSNLQCLLDHKISHIVCVRENMEKKFVRPNFPDTFKYLTVLVQDNPCENIMTHFAVVNSFIDDALENNGVILVHGNAGISRSATLVIAYVMQKFGMPSDEAYMYVRDRRFCINPNAGFLQQLKEYEPIYQAQRNINDPGTSGCGKSGLKRKMDEDMTDLDCNDNMT